MALSPKSRQCPTSVRHPASPARATSSRSSRVLPTPASPTSSTERDRGSPARPSRSASRASSRSRPRIGCIVSGSGATSSIIAEGTDTRSSVSATAVTASVAERERHQPRPRGRQLHRGPARYPVAPAAGGRVLLGQVLLPVGDLGRQERFGCHRHGGLLLVWCHVLHLMTRSCVPEVAGHIGRSPYSPLGSSGVP